MCLREHVYRLDSFQLKWPPAQYFQVTGKGLGVARHVDHPGRRELHDRIQDLYVAAGPGRVQYQPIGLFPYLGQYVFGLTLKELDAI